MKKLNHPYFYEYEPLRKICVQILRHEEIKYGREEDKIYGILFDGAYLWEEYIWTILKELKSLIGELNNSKNNGILKASIHKYGFLIPNRNFINIKEFIDEIKKSEKNFKDKFK